MMPTQPSPSDHGTKRWSDQNRTAKRKKERFRDLAVRRFFGVEHTVASYTLPLSVLDRRLVLGVPLLMLLPFVFAGVIAIAKCSLISPWGNAEEQTNYFQLARNFNAYGFLNSAFL